MALTIGCSTRPRDGTANCCDRCGWWTTADRIVMAVADGRGPEASYAADLAIACVGASLERDLQDTFAACDARLRGTDGVALAVAVVVRGTGQITVASVGNIRIALLIADDEYHLNGSSGIVGVDLGRLTLETGILSSGDLFALFSDRLGEPFSLRKALEGDVASPGDQASKMLGRWARDDDDAAVLIYRHQLLT